MPPSTAQIPGGRGSRRAVPASGSDGASPSLSAASIAPRPGIGFTCVCGASLWVPTRMAGRMFTCDRCKREIEVPPAKWDGAGARPIARSGSGVSPLVQSRDGSATLRAQRPPAVAAGTAMCGICQWPIQVGESRTKCPSCGLAFHADCWAENYGCSAYGCPQVNILSPDRATAPPDAAAPPEAEEVPAGHVEPGVPWEFLLLGANVIAALASAVSFGAPSLLAGTGALLYARKRGASHRGATIASACLAALGMAGGVLISYLWWVAKRA